jgi:hypothetical protein
MIGLPYLPQIVTAIGGLGTAAFGVVDATKVFGGGVNRIGFHRITTTIKELTPGGSEAGKHANELPQAKVVEVLKANWYNGVDLESQKGTAKSLIKIRLNSGNAEALAKRIGVDPDVLKEVASSVAAGTPLTPAQTNAYARFDLVLMALLDETYERSDQIYRNATRAWAALAAILLALACGLVLHPSASRFWLSQDFFESILVGTRRQGYLDRPCNFREYAASSKEIGDKESLDSAIQSVSCPREAILRRIAPAGKGGT